MITLILAMQIAGSAATAGAPTFIVVRDGQTTTSVPVTISDGQAFVRADLLVKAMRGTLTIGTNLHHTLALPRAHLDLIDGIPFAKFDSVTVPLTRAPQVFAGQLYLPFQFVSEIIPRYGGGYFYDVALGELRTNMSAAVSRAPPTVGVAGSSPPGGVASSPPGAVASSPTPAVAPPVTPRRTRPAAPPAPKVVVIDAGHGGPDRGMTGPIGSPVWFTEKDVTLSVAKKVATVLRARGVDVLMTRTTDTLIALADRGRIANSNHGDVFISIHCNAPGSNNAAGARERGFETYFLAEAKTEDERRVQDMENESVKFETGANAPKGDPLNFIITDMAQNEHLRESSDLAQTIQQGLIDVHPGPNRGVQQANFAVLRGSYMRY